MSNVQKPDYNPSGLLKSMDATGRTGRDSDPRLSNGPIIKYAQPSNAKLPPPTENWTLFVYKDGVEVEMYRLTESTCWFIGRDRSLATLFSFIPTDHPSCSKQHAVIQFRSRKQGEINGNGVGEEVLPYLLDLESANGTRLNGNQIDSRRFYELQSRDVVQFGFSSRQYVIVKQE